jgi:glycosyltransferase involved in cell wall biosynthesis
VRAEVDRVWTTPDELTVARPRSAPRRGVRGRLILAAHRVALAMLAAALRARPRAPARGERSKVTILLAHAYGIGGTTRTVLNVAGHLAGGHDVEVLSIVRRRDEPLLPHPPGVTVTAVDDQRAGPGGPLDRLLRALPSVLLLPVDRRMHGWASLRTDVALVRALWRVRAGVVMGTRPSLNVLVSALRRPGLVAIGQEHMNLDSHRPDLRHELLRCYRRLDAAVLLTDHDRDSFRSALGEGPRLVTIPNAVPPLPGPGSELDRPVVVAVGRLTPQKGFDRLIPAFAGVVRRRPDWTLKICGGGRMRRELERLIVEHELSDHVTLLGSVPHIERQLARASIFVLSSRFEGLPMAMIEAMSKNLPVVAFDCPTGPAEVVEHGRSGLLVPNGDVDALAAAILELIEDVPRRRAFGAAAAARAEAFSMDVVGLRWDSLISELA